MPINRQVNNRGLITSLAGYAHTYLYSVSYQASQPLYKVEMEFNLTSPAIIEEIVKIFYDSELSPGTWGRHFNISQVQCSGTIHGNYFFQPFTEIENVTSLLLNLYLSLFGDRRDNETWEALTNISDKMFELASIVGGSTNNPYNIIENITDRKLYTNDTLKLIISVTRHSTTMSKFSTDELHNAVIEDKARALYQKFRSSESINRIIQLRLNNDAIGAETAEYDIPDDQLNQLRIEYENTEYENAHEWTDPIPSTYNLRPRNTIDYSSYLNSRNSKTFNRRKRRARNFRGSGIDKYAHIFQIIDNHYHEFRNHIMRLKRRI